MNIKMHNSRGEVLVNIYAVWFKLACIIEVKQEKLVMCSNVNQTKKLESGENEWKRIEEEYYWKNCMCCFFVEKMFAINSVLLKKGMKLFLHR